MNRRDVLMTGMLAGAIATTGAIEPAEARASTPDRRAAKANDGTTLFVREWGRGKPMVFLHSWALESLMWRHQFVELGAKGIRCVAFDRRGHGRSDAPASGYDLDTLADDVAAVLSALDLRGVTLVGHSMGGGEVVRYLARHGSARIAKVALISSSTPFLTKTPDNPYGAPPEYFAALRAEWAADFPKWIEENKRPFFLPDTSPATMDWMVRMMASAYLPAALACNEAFAATDLRKDLATIDRPTIVIHGDKDVSAPLEITGRRTALGIPGATLKIYEGAPHGLFITHASRLNADLLEHAIG